MRKSIRIAAAAAAAGLTLAGVAVVSGAGASSAPSIGGHWKDDGPPAGDRIKVLDAAVATMKANIAAGKTRWGALDLRDVFSYNVDKLWHQGVDGSGASVAVIEGWEYPQMQQDLNTLDDQVGLPHTTVSTIYPTGPLPAACPPGMVKLGSYGSCSAWQGELRLDVEAVHLMAPYAKIVISATPSDSEVVGDPSSEVAMPEIVKAFEYISTNHLANVMSVSDGSSETDYSRGKAEITAQDAGELTAAANGVPIVNATGDCGAAQNLTTATHQCGALSSGPASATWGDSPYITAVGGDSPQHTYTGPNGQDTFPLDPIEGAGLSEIYSRPSYQDGIKDVSGSSMRSMPDITMDSRDGTSQSAPMFAGILAMATQVHRGDLGCINAALYENLGKHPDRSGLVDVTTGNNDIGDIPGYTAGPGYDVASGWGTVNAPLFVPALAHAAGHDGLARDAARQLDQLQGTLALTPSTRVAPTSTVDVTSTGFLPDHPVVISVDGTQLATVTADTSGNISYSFRAADKGFAAGKHKLSISSLLLAQSRTFTITP
jgi:subtilase family serine protease